MDTPKTYHQLAVEHPTNAGYRMMADRERVMMDDPNGTLARLRGLLELLRLGACTERDAIVAADIIKNGLAKFDHLAVGAAVNMALELARVQVKSRFT